MPAIAQMKLLINLAKIDGRVAEREKNYILNIGLANGFSTAEVEELFEKRHAIVVPDNLNEHEKFEYIFSLVQLMKIDEKIYKEEILFCSKIAAGMGFDQQVMFDLMLHVKAVCMENEDIHALKELTLKYLNETN